MVGIDKEICLQKTSILYLWNHSEVPIVDETGRREVTLLTAHMHTSYIIPVNEGHAHDFSFKLKSFS